MATRRRTAAAAPALEQPASSQFTDVVKSFDVYPKTLDDFKERTGSGAAVSVISLSIIFLLVVSEFRSYLTPTTTDHLYVDTTRGERIRVNLNVTFPNLPCAGMRSAAHLRSTGQDGRKTPNPHQPPPALQPRRDGRCGRAADRRGEQHHQDAPRLGRDQARGGA